MVLDADYRGEIEVPLYNDSNQMRVIEPGQRIAQLVIIPCKTVNFEVVNELSKTKRGRRGFGSTGKK